MSTGAIGANTPYSPSQVGQKPQEGKEMTTITVNCKNKKCEDRHAHDRSCPHTVSTKPAPKVGENGYLFDKRA